MDNTVYETFQSFVTALKFTTTATSTYYTGAQEKQTSQLRGSWS